MARWCLFVATEVLFLAGVVLLPMMQFGTVDSVRDGDHPF